MNAENAKENTPGSISSEEILELKFTEEELRQAETAKIKEEERLAEIARQEAEAAEKARLDAAWRDMEERRFEYERMAEDKRLKARQDLVRFFRNSAFALAAGTGLWLLSPLIMQLIPAQQPSASPVLQAPAEQPAATAPQEGTAELEEGLKLFDSQDFAKAAEAFHQSADKGNQQAQASLGDMYAAGQGVLQDYQQAMSWYQKAAEQGSPQGKAGLGAMYADGKGVPQDIVEAEKWFQLTGETASEEIKQRHATIQQSLTTEQLAEARQRAAAWAQQHQKSSPDAAKASP